MERAVFTLEEQLLKPVYSIYPWSPDLSPQRTPEKERLEQALFATTTRTEDESGQVTGRNTDTDPRGSPPSGLHSLSASTLPGKERETEAIKQRGQEWTVWGWVLESVP
jgi:hypothetical protein